MNARTALLLVNLLLLGGSGGLIYYLANSTYSTPYELRDADTLLAMVDRGYKVAAEEPSVVMEATRRLRSAKDFMRVLYTQTPTPTNTPAPTPTPVPLSVVLHSWAVQSLDDDSVDVLDQRTNEAFTLELNGGSRVVEFQGQNFDVTCCQIDLDKLEVGFCANGVMTIKTL